jgi:hypothetical protein
MVSRAGLSRNLGSLAGLLDLLKDLLLIGRGKKKEK